MPDSTGHDRSLVVAARPASRPAERNGHHAPRLSRGHTAGRVVGDQIAESGRKDLQVVGINDLGSPETNAHLTRYDTAHGKFPGDVAVEGDSMVVNGDRIKVLAQRKPEELPWGSLGVDVVLELVGGQYVAEDLNCVAPGGRIILVGLVAGNRADVDLGTILKRRLEIRGTVLRARPLEGKILLAKSFSRHVLPFIASGALKPVIDKKFALADAAEAHRYLSSNENYGKVVLEVA